MKKYITPLAGKSTPIYPVTAKNLENFLAKKDAATRQWAAINNFKAKPNTYCAVPNADGTCRLVLAGVKDGPDIWSFAHLPTVLGTGEYHIEGKFNAAQHEQFALGWQLSTYQFTRYKKSKKQFATLQLPKPCDAEAVAAIAQSIFLVRDLINTPANDMTPADLAVACKQVAKEFDAGCKVIVGDDLLKANYPAVHAVGRASSNPPHLIDIRWGKKNAPRVTLVGKGVCFDSGGLDLKNAAGMKLMKKDMGGAATVLGLARLIMLNELPVQLRVLIPAVENSVAGNAFRPLDIIQTRKGISVEIGNTDAEGRLILCDALYEADTEKPDLLIDFATLTGAARVALGPELPAYFTPDDKLAQSLEKHARDACDPLWRLPLWQPYRETLNTQVADINNAPDFPYAGAITAALYLNEFVEKTHSWLHVDTMAWNVNSRPGRPSGGEALCVRTLYDFIENRYAR